MWLTDFACHVYFHWRNGRRSPNPNIKKNHQFKLITAVNLDKLKLTFNFKLQHQLHYVMSRIEIFASMTSSSVSQSSTLTTTFVPGSINVSRCGLIFNPPILIIEYRYNTSERASDGMDGPDHSGVIQCKQIRIRRNTGSGCKVRRM